MNLPPEEFNSYAMLVAFLLAKDLTKEQVLELRRFILQVINNLNAYC